MLIIEHTVAVAVAVVAAEGSKQDEIATVDVSEL